jgi:hypothetical protein
VSHLPGVLGRVLVRPALVATAALVLTGCSSGGTGDAAAPPSGSPSAPTSSSPAPASTSPAPAAATSAAPAAGPTASAPGAGASGSGAASGPDRCSTGELTATLTGGDSGAGQRGAVLALRDTGGRTCDVEGFGGVGLQDAGGRALPTQQVREPSPAPTLLTVAPGATVVSQLVWTVVPSGSDPAAGCPTPASLAVIPPDEQDPLTVAWSLGPVCGGGRLQQQAYTAG